MNQYETLTKNQYAVVQAAKEWAARRGHAEEVTVQSSLLYDAVQLLSPEETPNVAAVPFCVTSKDVWYFINGVATTGLNHRSKLDESNHDYAEGVEAAIIVKNFLEKYLPLQLNELRTDEGVRVSILADLGIHYFSTWDSTNATWREFERVDATHVDVPKEVLEYLRRGKDNSNLTYAEQETVRAARAWRYEDAPFPEYIKRLSMPAAEIIAKQARKIEQLEKEAKK